MMNVNTAVDKVLCFFLFNNFSKVNVSELKAATISFYNDEELVKSKEILRKWPRMWYVMMVAFQQCQNAKGTTTRS